MTDFVSVNCHAKFGGNWTTSNGEMEGRGHNVPQAYVIIRDEPLFLSGGDGKGYHFWDLQTIFSEE